VLRADGAEHADRMPRWVVALIVILIIIVFIIPNPAGTGAYIGNAIDSLVVFFQNIGASATT